MRMMRMVHLRNRVIVRGDTHCVVLIFFCNLLYVMY